MVRELAYIENRNKRRACFTKRMKSLEKMLQQLTVLCDIEAAMISYGQNEQRPTLWPQDIEKVRDVLDRFRNLTLEQQTKNMSNVEIFLGEKIQKIQKKIAKVNGDCRELQACIIAEEFLSSDRPTTLEGFGSQDLSNVISYLEKKLATLRERLNAGQPSAPPVFGQGMDYTVMAEQLSMLSLPATPQASLNPTGLGSFMDMSSISGWSFFNPNFVPTPGAGCSNSGHPGPSDAVAPKNNEN